MLSRLRQASTSFRSAACARTPRPCYHTFSSYAGSSSSLRTAFRRGALFAAFSIASATVFFQTREKILLDAQAPASALTVQSGADATRKDNATGIEFPEILTIPSRVRLPPFQLLGLGVRSVSFLGIKVYSVGFYADISNLKIPENLTPDEKIDYIISNRACALRIIPTRNTSYSHLRDGFIRTLQARMSSQLKDRSITAQEAEDAQSPLRKLKSMFPSSPLKKGEPLDILLLPPSKHDGDKRTLVVRDLGSVENNWISREFIRAYFSGDGLSSPMKASVVEFLTSSPEPLTN